MASSDGRRRPRLRELPPGTDLLDYLLSLPPEAREEMVRAMGMDEADGFDGDWPSWAHEGQQPPAKCADGSDWSTCVVMGGRGFGKTLAGAKWIEAAVAAGAESRARLRIALVGATLAEARRVMVEGNSGLLEVAGHCIREWRPAHGLLRFRGGSEAQLFSGHTPELLRGPQHHLAWCDELAKWEKAEETWDMLQLGLRLGQTPRALVTTTPRPGPVLKAIMAEPDCVRIGGPTDLNPHNSERWRRRMRARYAGTRLERQELNGELLTDNPGALWTEALLESCRLQVPPHPAGGEGDHPKGGGGVTRAGEPGFTRRRGDPEESEPGPGREAAVPSETPDPWDSHGREEGRGPSAASRLRVNPDFLRPIFTRIVLAVDPPAGDGTCGIIACAKDSEGIAHVLADHSVTARTPEGWSSAVADAAQLWSALIPSLPKGVELVAEQNQGGLMVQSVLRIADPALRPKLVTATQGKSDRAAPVAMLFEAGRVLLHGRFPALEAELCGMIAGGDYEGPGSSPDRADAMVWALTELMLQKEAAMPRIRSL